MVCDLLKIIVLTWSNKDWNSDLITCYTLSHRHSSLFEFGKDWSLFNLSSTEPAASSLFPTFSFQAGPLPCILGSKLLGFVQCFGQSAVCHRYDSKLFYLDSDYWKDYSHWEMKKPILCFEWSWTVCSPVLHFSFQNEHGSGSRDWGFSAVNSASYKCSLWQWGWWHFSWEEK